MIMEEGDMGSEFGITSAPCITGQPFTLPGDVASELDSPEESLEAPVRENLLLHGI